MRQSSSKPTRPSVLIVGPYPPPFGGVATFIRYIMEGEAINKDFDLRLFRNGKRDQRIPFAVQAAIELLLVVKFFITMALSGIDAAHIHTSASWGFIRHIPYILISKKISRSKAIIHIHGGDFGRFFHESGRLKRYLIGYTLRSSDCIIVPTNIFAENVRGLCGGNICVCPIYNAYDPEMFHPVPESDAKAALNIPADRRVILAVGNLMEVKGHRYLIQAISDVVKRQKNILCIIIGGGGQRERLMDQIVRSGLEEHVKILGTVDHKDIPLWMNACDLFVFPSIKESFGIVQIEAMACGKAVIATCNGASEEIIVPGKTGALCSPANPRELAEKIIAGLDREWDRVEICDYAKRFSWPNISMELADLYTQVIDGEIP